MNRRRALARGLGFELVIHAGTARSLELVVPASLRARATGVI
jgi:hypothetical protein